MRRIVNSWIYIIAKKALISRSFIVLLLVIPMLCFCLGKLDFSHKEDEIPTIYLYCEDNDETSGIIIDNLLGSKDGYTFVLADSIEEIEHDVRTHKVLCGFVFAENLTSRIEDGTIRDNITIYERVGSIKADIVRELVFSAYYREYARVYTPVYMDFGENSEFSRQYNDIVGETIFEYQIETLPSESKNETNNNLIRGVIAILMCLMAQLFNVEFINDSRNGIFYPVKKEARIFFRILYFLIPLLMVVPFAFLGIVISGVMNSVLYELGRLLLYALILAFLSFIMSYIIRSRKLIIASIPLLTIIYLVALPVFVDLSSYIHFISLLRYFCPPFYFL